MSENVLGYLEGIFMVVTVVAFVILAARVFHPKAKADMEDHANIPFRDNDDEIGDDLGDRHVKG